jgi:toxin YoeB
LSKAKAVFEDEFIDDLRYWVKNNRKIATHLLDLVEHILREPFAGIGKPEPLKHLGPDIWSRRLTQEHRIVYRITKTQIYFLQGRYHY